MSEGMRRARLLVPALLLALGTASAPAEVREATPDAAFVVVTTPISAPPPKVWQALLHVKDWWGDDYTFSGSAANLQFAATAGACLCEQWEGNGAVQGRVLMVLPERLLRLDSALGPLQEYALKGVLEFWLKYAEDGSSVLDVEYRLIGASGSGLDVAATRIDAQLRDQSGRLKRLVETGTAEQPKSADGEVPVSDAAQQAASRAAILEAWKRSAEQASPARSTDQGKEKR
ncbi:hypothetical protein [Dokdonella sp.]|uniref:hypothetical protein n=1 Tax=Dokdonella sp. TaxID=2291710 RepID=UPI0031C3D3B0|nr:hypothetical protein [Dokdonella sp.]